MKVEIRNGTAEVSGYVNAVGRESRVLRDGEGYFTETIAPGAFARALTRGKRQMLLNHEKTRVIGNEGENLELKEDAVGLFARATVDDAEVIEKAKNRELRGWSFGFVPIKQRFEEKDGIRHRVVEDMNLYEVSIIDQRKLPAYAATSVFTRDAGGDDDLQVEYRTMELQDVETSEERADDAQPAIDYSTYTNVIKELKAE